MRWALISAPCALVLAGCAAGTMPTDRGPSIASASADIRDRSGMGKGRAAVREVGDGIRVEVTATSLPAGAYGAHIHSVGRCDAPGFESAGSHWNPTNQQHGKDNPRGMHKGDLPNLMVGADGRGVMEITVPNVSLAGAGSRLLDGDGASIVIHATADDYRTDPSGNSGARIACGVFR